MDSAALLRLNLLHRGSPLEDRRRPAAAPSGQQPDTGTLEPRMSTEPKLTGTSPSLHPATADPRHALPGDWVRPFGDKVTALQRRRRNTEAARRAANDACPGAIALSNADSTVAFHLLPAGAGLLVERTQHRPSGTVLRQTVLLRNHQQFEAWCSVEPLRLAEPAVWARLRRSGDELLGGRD